MDVVGLISITVHHNTDQIGARSASHHAIPRQSESCNLGDVLDRSSWTGRIAHRHGHRDNWCCHRCGWRPHWRSHWGPGNGHRSSLNVQVRATSHTLRWAAKHTSDDSKMQLGDCQAFDVSATFCQIDLHIVLVCYLDSLPCLHSAQMICQTLTFAAAGIVRVRGAPGRCQADGARSSDTSS